MVAVSVEPPSEKRLKVRRTSILYLHTHQEQVGQLGDVNGTRTSCAEESLPIVLDFSIEAAVFDIVRQEILHLEWGVETKRDPRVRSAQSRIGSARSPRRTGKRAVGDIPQERISLVMDSVGLESEGFPLSVLAENRSGRSLDQVLPVKVLGRPSVSKATCVRKRSFSTAPSRLEQPDDAPSGLILILSL